MISKKDVQKFDKDNELWETKKLGASAEHAVPASAEEQQAIDDATGLQLLSFRIQKSVIEQLRQLAKLEGIGYQPLMRRIIGAYVRENEHRLQTSPPATEVAERADKLLATAMELQRKLTKLPALSQNRIAAESAYTKSLREALLLFTQAFESTNDIVVKAHASKRIGQIHDLCKQQLKSEKAKKQAG